MKKSNLLLLGAVIAIFFFSLIFQLAVHQNVRQEKANRKPMQMLEQNRDIPDFSSISAQGRMKVYFEQQQTSSLSIKAPDYFMDSIRTEVFNKKLKLALGSGLRKKDSVVIRIAQPGLDSLELMSQVQFETTNKVSGTQLYLDFKGESTANLNLDYESVMYKNTSSGSIALNGEISKIEILETKNK